MKVTYENGKYVVLSTYAEKDIPKAAGCRWDPEARVWWTDKAPIAAKLENFFDDKARAAYAVVAAVIESSRKTDAAVSIPAPAGLEYLPFQKAGIDYCRGREATIVADEMGLGKTIQALGVINSDESVRRVIVICPASLRLNWQREATKWLVRPMSIQIIEGKKPVELTGDMVIINYDVVSAHRTAIDAIGWDLLVADEAHYLKNGRAQRTIAVVGKYDKDPTLAKVAIRARRRLLLTGTPIVNRPIELWTLLSYVAPGAFTSFWSYAKRYCGATQGEHGWDMTGATNLGELQDSLRASCMVRRLKSEVLKELPAKRRQVIELPANGASGAVKEEVRATKAIEGKLNELQARLEMAEANDEATDDAITNAKKLAFTEMAAARHATAVAKIPYCAEHIAAAVESSGRVVAFAHHHDVIDGLAEALRAAGLKVVTLTGRETMAQRQAAVDIFQAGQADVFLGGIDAAGVGLTLTAASHVVFCELPWTPAALSQAEDRCHRIGQRESVLIQHIVLDGSIDQRMAQALVEKQEIIDKALDLTSRVTLSIMPVLPIREKRSNRKDAIDALAECINDEQIAAAHAALRALSGMDTDHATDINGVGFSKIDVEIGHRLAEVAVLSKKQAALATLICRKYHRQIDVSRLAA